MAYDYADGERDGLSTGAKVAIGVLVLLGALIMIPAAYGVYTIFLASPETKFERQLAADPKGKAVTDALKAHFPADYARLRSESIAMIERGASSAEQTAFSSSFFNRFMHDHAVQAAAAPDKEMGEFFDARIAAANLFQGNPALCREVMTTGDIQSYKMKPEESARLQEATRRYILAAAAGRDHPQPRGEMSNADKLALQAQLHPHGVTDLDLMALGSNSTEEDRVQRRCFVLAELYKALRRLPPAQGVRAQAQLVRGM